MWMDASPAWTKSRAFMKKNFLRLAMNRQIVKIKAAHAFVSIPAARIEVPVLKIASAICRALNCSAEAGVALPRSAQQDYRRPSSPVRPRACNLPQQTNIEQGLEKSGMCPSLAKSMTSGAGRLPLT